MTIIISSNDLMEHFVSRLTNLGWLKKNVHIEANRLCVHLSSFWASRVLTINQVIAQAVIVCGICIRHLFLRFLASVDLDLLNWKLAHQLHWGTFIPIFFFITCMGQNNKMWPVAQPHKINATFYVHGTWCHPFFHFPCSELLHKLQRAYLICLNHCRQIAWSPTHQIDDDRVSEKQREPEQDPRKIRSLEREETEEVHADIRVASTPYVHEHDGESLAEKHQANKHCYYLSAAVNENSSSDLLTSSASKGLYNS